MSKPDDASEESLGQRLRGVVEAIENVFLPEDDYKRPHPGPHHPGSALGEQLPKACPPVVVNVNVTCATPGSGCKPCPPGSGGGHGQPGRPTHTTGTSDGSVDKGVTVGSIIDTIQRPPRVWPGERSQLAVFPLLFIRGSTGDTGARPLVGPFWESPDIFILGGVHPDDAPPRPPALGEVAKANQDNTVYAHVWNMGQNAVNEAIVEFYWFNPTLGFSEGHQNLIGFERVTLAGRGAQGSHALVKCRTSWKATYQNGGHECLVVRVWHRCMDPLGSPPWDASQNRHVAQRNIHVMTASEAAAKPTLGIQIGPLFGQPAQVQVARADPANMPWLHLVTNDRHVLPGNGIATGDVGITGGVPASAGLPNLGAIPNARAAGLIGNAHGVSGDGVQVGFVTTDGNPGAGNAHVYRVSGSQNGQTFGGYTVVIVGE